MNAAGESTLQELVKQFPRERTHLLPALIAIQEETGWLSAESIELLAAHLRVPKSEAFGVASSFPDLRLTPVSAARDAERTESWSPPPEARLVQDGSCTRAVASAQAGDRAVAVGCPGNCWQAPAWSLDGETWLNDAGTVWRRPSDERLLRRAGRVSPLASLPYRALEKALSIGSDAVWDLVGKSGLRGRGGAYFPIGAKWETARNTAAEVKYLLVNAEEGEPGIYKDRHLMEGGPHQLLEGIQIAALGIGATNVVLFVNGEARLSHERLRAALDHAESAIRVPVEIRLGAGGYVLGEETALINAIHGYRSEPLARPPFPAVSGLHAKPTVINNAETLANLPDIVLEGPEWFRSVGTPDTPGTKLVSLTGDVNRPGLHEVPTGTPIARVIDVWGGGAKGTLKAMLVGGPSGSILPADLAETPLDVRPLQDVGGVLGAGGIVALNDTHCPVHEVRGFVAYNARESCGKCTPCREGTVRVQALFDRLVEGKCAAAELETLDYLNDILAYGSLCGLGQMAPNPVRALLRHFGDEVREHLAGECRAGVCR